MYRPTIAASSSTTPCTGYPCLILSPIPRNRSITSASATTTAVLPYGSWYKASLTEYLTEPTRERSKSLYTSIPTTSYGTATTETDQLLFVHHAEEFSR